MKSSQLVNAANVPVNVPANVPANAPANLSDIKLDSFLTSIIHCIQEPMFVKDQYYRYVLCNPAFIDLWIHQKTDQKIDQTEMVIGQTDHDYCSIELADRLRSHDIHCHTTGQETLTQDDFTDASGQIKTLETRRSLVHDQQGNPFIVGTIREVTIPEQSDHFRQQSQDALEALVTERTANLQRAIAKHQQVTNALRASEQKFRNLFDTMTDAVMLINEQTVIDCNLAALETFGCISKTDLCGKLLMDFSPLIQPNGEISVSLSDDYFGAALHHGRMQFEWLYSRLDGSQFSAEVLLSKVQLDNQQVVLSIARDISDRKQANQKIQQSEERLRTLIRSLPVILFCLDPSGRFTFSDGQGLERLGIAPNEMLGMSVFDIYAEYPDILQTIRQALAGASMRTVTAIADCYFETRYTPLIDDLTKQVIGVIGVAFDMTEQHHAESALKDSEMHLRQQAEALEKTLMDLKQTQAQLVHNEKMSSLGELVAGVAHEINNPVNFIHGNITPAKEYVDELLHLIQLYQTHYPEPVSELVEAIAEMDLDFIQTDLSKLLASMRLGTDRIRKIVLSLRNFSRLDESDHKRADIHEGIDSTLLILDHRLKATAARPGIEVVKTYGDLPYVECYAGQLNQVLMNILGNAIDALEERDQGRTLEQIMVQPSRIEIFTTVEKNWISIRIRDNGNGMSEAVRQKIFNPFFTTKEVGKGTGMGMSISHQIITEKHGGLLQCNSTLGQGTELLIKIPIALSPQI